MLRACVVRARVAPGHRLRRLVRTSMARVQRSQPRQVRGWRRGAAGSLRSTAFAWLRSAVFRRARRQATCMAQRRAGPRHGEHCEGLRLLPRLVPLRLPPQPPPLLPRPRRARARVRHACSQSALARLEHAVDDKTCAFSQRGCYLRHVVNWHVWWHRVRLRPWVQARVQAHWRSGKVQARAPVALRLQALHMCSCLQAFSEDTLASAPRLSAQLGHPELHQAACCHAT